MNTFTVDEAKSLLSDPCQLCISLFMPLQRGGAGSFQNPARLRNLLAKVAQDLEGKGYGEDAIRNLLQPVQSLAEDASFRDHPDAGLAIFLAPGIFRYYRLPRKVEEMVTIGSRFQVRPLLPLLSGDGRFYVLALSQNAVRLLEGTRDRICEIGMEGVPHSLAEELQFDERQADQNVNYNAGRPFPGNNEPKEDRKEKLARFFHLIDQALPHSVKVGSDPLVLAAVGYEDAIYRQVTTCSHVISEGIVGNPERLSLKTLHDRAWAIVQPHFEEGRRQAAAQYRELNGTGLTSEDLGEIETAARSGRVASLLVTEAPPMYGRFDPAVGSVEVHRQAEAGDEDLVNLAAIETLLHGGTVYVDAAETDPHAKPIAALLRY
jgi:hypothetical protein